MNMARGSPIQIGVSAKTVILFPFQSAKTKPMPTAPITSAVNIIANTTL